MNVAIFWVLLYLLHYAALFVVTFICYLAVMNLQRVKETKGLSKPATVVGTLILFVGLFCDWLLNIESTLFPFVDLPASKGELVTGRLKRYKYVERGWRGRIADYLAVNFLDDFDPRGRHV